MNLKSLVPFGNGGTRAAPPANVFGTLHREIDRLFDDFTRGGLGFGPQGQTNLMPSIDVTETDKQIEIAAELPGLERKDVEISLEDDLLTIRGEKKIETKKEEDKDKNYHVSERSYGVFYRDDPASARRRPEDSAGDDVQGRPEDHHSETGRNPADEDRGQGSRLTPRGNLQGRALSPPPLPQRARPNFHRCG